MCFSVLELAYYSDFVVPRVGREHLPNSFSLKFLRSYEAHETELVSETVKTILLIVAFALRLCNEDTVTIIR